MNSKHPLKLGLVFSVVIFLIILVSSVISFVIAIYFHLNLFSSITNRVLWPIINLYAISVIVGTAISFFVGKGILSPIVKLSGALTEVGRGNFNMKLDESKYRVEELKEMAHNFNIMVKELNTIETFRNDFIANVSHEFKTPIASIEGYTTLLQSDKLTEDEKIEYTKKILNSTRRLSTLITVILQISKLENQGIIAEKNKFKLDEQIRQTLLLFESKWSNKNINLDINLDPITFFGNEEILMHVWINLISNAIKFTPINGTIKCTLKQSDNFIIATISDNGIGMSDEVQKHIFDKFYQGDKSHSSEGNGLGLALVKRIIDLCDATIEVKSEYKNGSTFIVKFPC